MPPDPISENTIAAIAIISIFVLFPMAVAMARLIWRRASPPDPPRQVRDDDTSRRLMEMQQSIDAMALELERISEGQRFVTKLMNERPVGELAASSKPAARRGL